MDNCLFNYLGYDEGRGEEKCIQPFIFVAPVFFHWIWLMGLVLEVTAQESKQMSQQTQWSRRLSVPSILSVFDMLSLTVLLSGCLNKSAAFSFSVDPNSQWQIFPQLYISDQLEISDFFLSLHSCSESFFWLVSWHRDVCAFCFVALGTMALPSSSSSSSKKHHIIYMSSEYIAVPRDNKQQ